MTLDLQVVELALEIGAEALVGQHLLGQVALAFGLCQPRRIELGVALHDRADLADAVVLVLVLVLLLAVVPLRVHGIP